MTTRYSVGFASDLEVTGYNPEAADLDRPRGEIIAPRWFALAEDAHGNRRRWGSFETEAQAEAAYLHVAPPISEWSETYPAYGSRAYQSYGESDLIEAERRHDEDSLCFDTRFTRYHGAAR